MGVIFCKEKLPLDSFKRQFRMCVYCTKLLALAVRDSQDEDRTRTWSAFCSGSSLVEGVDTLDGYCYKKESFDILRFHNFILKQVAISFLLKMEKYE